MEMAKVTIVSSYLIMAITLMLDFTCAHNSPRDFLDAHNPARAEVSVPPLVWNNTLASYAQAYAGTRKDCALLNSNGPYGENVANASCALSAKEVVGRWVEERPYYDYASNGCIDQECSHYTQIVWNDTKSVGCARVRCHQNGWTFIVCSYYPPGNGYLNHERPYYLHGSY